MALESAINAGFSQRAFENIPRLNSHLNGDRSRLPVAEDMEGL